jgi:hypothetical protein
MHAHGATRVASARNENGDKAKLYSDADNWSALQSLLDGSTHITLPVGNWPISRTLNGGRWSQFIQGQGVERTTLRQYGDYAGPVVGFGGGTAWSTGTNYVGAQGMQIQGLTLHQQSQASGTNCFQATYQEAFVGESDHLTIRNVRVRGSRIEGIVVASDLHHVLLSDVEAWDCGNDAPVTGNSTAGINATSQDTIIEKFRCVRCGQGVETGNTNVTVRKGVVSDPGPGLPSLGINIGSASWGVYNTVVEDCVIAGYDSGIVVGNGIGRLSRVIVRRNIIRDASTEGAGSITFAGGQEVNNVVHPDQGPDTYGSEISDNEMDIFTTHNGVILYNTGPSPVYEYAGREPLSILRNIIRFNLADPSQQGAPVIGFAGKIVADCLVEGNQIYGLPDAPVRGDVQSYTSGTNQAVQGFPNLRVVGNNAWVLNNRLRSFSTRIEGA